MTAKHTLAALVVGTAACAGFSTSALAQQNTGTLYFDGMITDAGCTPDINGWGSPNATITLPQASVTDLPNVGDTFHWTPFSISVSGCNNSVNNVWAYFSHGDANHGTGRLDNSGTAQGVDLQLTDGSQVDFWVWGDALVDVTGDNPALVGGEATMDFGVQYYRTGALVPGTVQADVQYSLQFN